MHELTAAALFMILSLIKTANYLMAPRASLRTKWAFKVGSVDRTWTQQWALRGFAFLLNYFYFFSEYLLLKNMFENVCIMACDNLTSLSCARFKTVAIFLHSLIYEL